MRDACICRINFRDIVRESTPLLGKKFRDQHSKVWTFYGVVWGEDDLYYGMWRKRDESEEMMLLSCVGSIDGHGYTLIEEPA